MNIQFRKPRRPVAKVFLHCSASDSPAHDNVATIRRWHLARGFNDVGYNFFIQKDGTVERGRDIEKVPAAQKGHNTGSIAICLHGLDVDLFTAEQFASLRDLAEQINEAYSGRVTFHGHCEVSPKTCPVFDYRLVLGLDRRGRMLPRAAVADAVAFDADDEPARGKPMHKSKTGWAAIGVGVATATGTAREISQNVSDTGAALNISPVSIILAAAVVGLAGFIWWDRRRKAREFGV